MALGRRQAERQGELWVASASLPKSIGHVFYEKLNGLLHEAGFDRFVEELCAPYYHDSRGRPSIPPGTYFRMLLVGYFEGIDSQRGIAWRCADSLSLREFLGIAMGKQSPDHSTLSVIRGPLPEEAHVAVFQWVLNLARVKKLLDGRRVGVDSTTLEANAAMKSIVRKDTGDDWKQYVKTLMVEAGEIESDDEPTDDELRKFDRKRGGKRVSNEDWVSDTDGDARIAKMKDGTTHLAYKAEHAVDLDSQMVLAAEIYYADESDTKTLEDTVNTAQAHLLAAGCGDIREVVVDKGYHSGEVIETFANDTRYRLYAAEKSLPDGKRRRWKGLTRSRQQALRNHQRWATSDHGRALQRQRSEIVERSFAHTCETGGARRSWLRGVVKVAKRYLMTAAAHNLGCLMRKLFGIGTPRGRQQFTFELLGPRPALKTTLWYLTSLWRTPTRPGVAPEPPASRPTLAAV